MWLASHLSLRRGLISLCLLTFVLAAPTVLAAPAAPPANKSAQAKNAFLEGKEHYQKDNNILALDRFKSALELWPRPSILVMIANCYRRLKQPDKALKYYREYLKMEAQSGGELPVRREVEALVADLDEVVTEVERGEQLVRQKKYDQAQPLLQKSLNTYDWAKPRELLGLCYLQLGKTVEARSEFQKALYFWEHYETSWRKQSSAPHPPDEQELQDNLHRLRDLLAQNSAPAEALTENAAAAEFVSPDSQPFAPTESATTSSRTKKRSRTWLYVAIAATTLTVGSEIFALVNYSKGNNVYANSPAFDSYRNKTIVGHVLAGVFAATAGVSYYFYFFHRQARTDNPANASGAPSLMPGWHFAAFPLAGGGQLAAELRY